MSIKTLFLGSDHAGFELKERLFSELQKLGLGLEIKDCGTHGTQSVDYPEVAEKVSKLVASSEENRGILICGTGIGMSIAANKVPGIRAACVWSVETAKLSREHNDANILCLGGRLVDAKEALEWTKIWLNTSFLEGRHLNRVRQIKKLEEQK